ncbi:MAG TPA: hypothetical protein H9829_06760 [Candidatus Tetragenococcus pullicola]|nr:hypothetical protein [Candidatus Tetragenococcus pullicola]
MEPFLAMFSGLHDEKVKVVKVIDFNWFPNMAPTTYSEKNIQFVEHVIGSKRVDFSPLLPFP